MVRHLIAVRETTDVVCAICGELTPAGSPQPLTIVVSHDEATGSPVAHYAHARCARSGFTGLRVAADSDELASTCRVAVRAHATTPAVFFWQTWRQAMTAAGEDVGLGLQRQLGLCGSADGLMDPTPTDSRAGTLGQSDRRSAAPHPAERRTVAHPDADRRPAG
jgi:hypothetical protein